VEQVGFIAQVLAQALGALLAAAVIYLAAVLAGVIPWDVVLGLLSLAYGIAGVVLGAGLAAGAGWATRLVRREPD
jgi:hypothetical protein